MRSKCWDACKEGNLPVFGYQPRSPPAKYDGGVAGGSSCDLADQEFLNPFDSPGFWSSQSSSKNQRPALAPALWESVQTDVPEAEGS